MSLAPSQEQGLQLLARLKNLDPVASSDLIQAYLEPLLCALRHQFPRLDDDLYHTAAEDTLFDLVKNPHRYDSSRSELFPYLRMAAIRDLQTLMRKETRYREHEKNWNVVEDSPEGEKYLGREDDPSFRLRIVEVEAAEDDPVLQALLDEMNESEREAFDLLRGGERRTEMYAQALGLSDLSKEEQETEVKRWKDRWKKKIERARRKHE